jgi:hypothetical protein
MDPRRAVWIALLAAPLAALPARAEEAPAAPTAETTEAPAMAPKLEPLYADPAIMGRRMSPMVSELMTAIDEQRTVLRGLKARLAQTREPKQMVELHRAISAAKRDTEVRLLRIQADHARREGRFEAATKLDASIAAMNAPPVARESKPADASRATAR